MSYRIFEKVMTPDNEQGFVSQIFSCGGIDVDIRCDESEDRNETTTYFYEKGDGVITSIPGETPDGCPVVGDITPYGTVIKSVQCYENHFYLVQFSKHKDYEGENRPMIWLSWSYVDRLEEDYFDEYNFMDEGQWTDAENFDKIADYFDLEGRFKLSKKRITYHEIPEQCELVLTMPDGNTKTRLCGIPIPGLIETVDRVQNASEDNQITTLAELRELGAAEIELHAVFTLKGF